MNWFQKFKQSKNINPIILGLATGLYPMFFYYTNNFTLVNSLKHLAFFIGLFLVAPVALFIIIGVVSKWSKASFWRSFLPAFFNVALFLVFIEVCLYAEVQVVITVVAVGIALAFAYFLHKHLKKLVVVQYILAALGLIALVPILYQQLTYTTEWIQQPDGIEEVVFKKRPNVYYIQPDGYLNFSEFDKGDYKIDNNDFKQFLIDKKFSLYDNFRTNYNATLVSNTSIFAMRHHYNNIGFNLSEVINGREIIVTKNPVLDIFKKNNYKTHLLAEFPFFLTSFAEMGYDECNFTLEEDVSFVGKGYYKFKNIDAPLERYLNEDNDRSKFFFIQMFGPGHVTFYKKDSKGAAGEREKWIQRLDSINPKLDKLITTITDHDPEGIIVMMGDHGGYVGLDYMEQIHTKTTDRDILYSAFSTQLAIRWPDGAPSEYNQYFKSSVNLFRLLFAYLGEEPNYLDHLEEDSSFIVIEKGAPKGVYECINPEGKIVFKKAKVFD